MNVTCTIITADYLHYALALYESLLQQDEFILYILIADQTIDKTIVEYKYQNIKILFLEDIQQDTTAEKIIKKYHSIQDSTMRWALKPIMATYLLDKYEKVLVLDADLYFFGDYQFLFDDLNTYNVLLTPHWRNSNPYMEEDDGKYRFEVLFTSGLFNAGFVAVNRQGKKAMQWWANCCLYRCDINVAEGHYADQTYLNLIPIYFDKVKIIQHKGCNVAEWNRIECQRTLMSNSEIWINKKYPIIFIHFTGDLVRDIKEGKEPLLESYLNKWQESLQKYHYISNPYKLQKAQLLQTQEEAKQATEKLINSEKNNIFQNFKQKLRIRTRILRFIEG